MTLSLMLWLKKILKKTLQEKKVKMMKEVIAMEKVIMSETSCGIYFILNMTQFKI